MRIAIINGPNLNLLGRREPEIYGTMTFADYLKELKHLFPQDDIQYYQSNHEGDLIDWVQKEGFEADGIVINPGGYAHTSIALRDAVSAVPAKTVEVHISNIYEREAFRHHSYLTDVAYKTHIGEGLIGYQHAIEDIHHSGPSY